MAKFGGEGEVWGSLVGCLDDMMKIVGGCAVLILWSSKDDAEERLFVDC